MSPNNSVTFLFLSLPSRRPMSVGGAAGETYAIGVDIMLRELQDSHQQFKFREFKSPLIRIPNPNYCMSSSYSLLMYPPGYFIL
jgi:hypothetical protein